jgi:hypothetical protein
MEDTPQTCHRDCINEGNKNALECYTECTTCITTLGCWADATAYGDAADQTCNISCYGQCGTAWPATSKLCDCSHGFCIFGCPANCPASTLMTCNIDCIPVLSDLVACLGYCNDCVTVGTCWADAAEYGDAADYQCLSNCYETCEANLGAGSDLCSCAHGFCVLGCPSNCDDSDLKTCNVDCLATLTAATKIGDCEVWCKDCVTTQACWTDMEYGSSADVSCDNDCYLACETNLGAGSDLCSCAGHGACVMGCPGNCDEMTDP